MDTSLGAETRTELLVDAMTLPQKVQQLHGSGVPTPELLPACDGTPSTGYATFRNVTGIPELAIPTFRITNGPVGVGYGDCTPQEPATALPVGLALAATFDADAAYAFGDIAGRESRILGLHEFEAPGLNMARIAHGGRNFEYFGEDPYLTGVMGVGEVLGVQDNDVIAMAKHYIMNDQEKDRGNVSVQVDESVMHELYLLPFEMAVKDGDMASLMCSYNKIDGVYSCENEYTLTTVLRDMWGFDGYVQSDFGATHSTAPALNAGLDLEMQNGRHMTLENIEAALADGTLTMDTIDQALSRRYLKMFEFGMFDRPITRAEVPAEHGQVSREIAEGGAVLLKNEDGALPLSAEVGTIALIGQTTYVDAAVAGGGGSSRVIPTYTVNAQEGLQNALDTLGSDAAVTKVTVADDLSNLQEAVDAAAAADVVVLMAGLVTAEGRDQITADNEPILNLPTRQDELIDAVADANADTVLVLKDGDPVLMPWIDKVPAILEAWNPGQEDGNVVANLLFGLANPSGKLPITYPANADETPTANDPRRYPGLDLDGALDGRNGGPTIDVVHYDEGREMGYRWYDANNVEPLFEFGYGLSYTSFELSGLSVAPTTQDGTGIVKVRFTVQNTGDLAGSEVPQVYLSFPDGTGQPPQRLVAFDKVELAPGEASVVELTIDPAASSHPLSVWDQDRDAWVTPSGEYEVRVGTSSRDIALTDTMTVTAPEEPRPQPQYGFLLTDGWAGGQADHAFGYGRFTDEALVGDWDGNGTDSITVRRDSTFYVNNAHQGGEAQTTFAYGRADDEAYVGDWDGDGTDTVALRRGNQFFVKNALVGGEADVVMAYGRPGDEVYVGDWDGDGTDTVALRRGNQFFVKNALVGGEADVVMAYGRPGDEVYVGDWNGDGTDTVGVRRTP